MVEIHFVVGAYFTVIYCSFVLRGFLLTLFVLALSVPGASAMTITLNPDAGLSGNAAALGAFNRAAQTWSSVFSDPIIVSINAGLATLGSPSIIGQADSTILAGGYTTVRDAMVADAANEASNGIVAYLPTAAQFTAMLPVGFGLTGNIMLTRANALALGFVLDPDVDGTITFNDAFAFDYDNSDGVTSGSIDFETVALHEIGHVLGFFSAVDEVDYYRGQSQTADIDFSTLDLFRFSTAANPSNTSQFTSNSRYLVANSPAVFSDGTQSWQLSTGYFTGDGRQASHWKDDGLTGSRIGVMDPTLNNGALWGLTAADLRVLDLIGYDVVPTPEPGTFALMGAAGLVAVILRRRR